MPKSGLSLNVTCVIFSTIKQKLLRISPVSFLSFLFTTNDHLASCDDDAVLSSSSKILMITNKQLLMLVDTFLSFMSLNLTPMNFCKEPLVTMRLVKCSSLFAITSPIITSSTRNDLLSSAHYAIINCLLLIFYWLCVCPMDEIIIPHPSM